MRPQVGDLISVTKALQIDKGDAKILDEHGYLWIVTDHSNMHGGVRARSVATRFDYVWFDGEYRQGHADQSNAG